jgi:hypothetical protein
MEKKKIQLIIVVHCLPSDFRIAMCPYVVISETQGIVTDFNTVSMGM